MKIVAGHYLWTKGARHSIGKHFSTQEFECQCTYPDCGEQRIATDLVHRLDDVRDELGAAIFINSGYRCTKHQRDLTADPTIETVSHSEHEEGNAADIRARLMTPLAAILPKHFKAIGLAPTWAHVDLRADKVRRWNYKR